MGVSNDALLIFDPTSVCEADDFGILLDLVHLVHPELTEASLAALLSKTHYVTQPRMYFLRLGTQGELFLLKILEYQVPHFLITCMLW